MVVRKNTYEISAYLNICTHRGAKIAKDKGQKAYSFKCPYHSWVYNLEGQLIGRPREKAFSKIPKENCSLKEIKIHNNKGFLWITLNSKASKEYKKGLNDLKSMVENYNLKECKLETGRTHQIRVHMNYLGNSIVGDDKYKKKRL